MGTELREGVGDRGVDWRDRLQKRMVVMESSERGGPEQWAEGRSLEGCSLMWWWEVIAKERAVLGEQVQGQVVYRKHNDEPLIRKNQTSRLLIFLSFFDNYIQT